MADNLISSLIGGVSSVVSTRMALNHQDKVNQENRDYNDKLIAEDRAYNDPSAQAARLRAAGISPSLLGLDNIASSSSPVQAESSADAIMQGAAGLSDVLSGFASRQLDEQRINLKSEELDEEKRQNVIRQENADREFDLKSKYYSSLIHEKSLQADKIAWDNSNDVYALAFQLAVNGDSIPDNFDESQKNLILEAQKSIDRSSFTFRTQRALAEKGLSESEANKAFEAARESYVKEFASLDMRVNRQLDIARKQLENVKLGLQNETESLRQEDISQDIAAKSLSNQYREETFASSVEASNSESASASESARYKIQYIEDTKKLIQMIDDALNDSSIRRSLSRKYGSNFETAQLREWKQRLQESLNLMHDIPFARVPYYNDAIQPLQRMKNVHDAYPADTDGIGTPYGYHRWGYWPSARL